MEKILGPLLPLKTIKQSQKTAINTTEFTDILANDWDLYRASIYGNEMAILLKKGTKLFDLNKIDKKIAKQKVRVYFQGELKWELIWPVRESTAANILFRSRMKLKELESLLL